MSDPNALTPLQRSIFRARLDEPPLLQEWAIEDEETREAKRRMSDEHRPFEEKLMRLETEIDSHERETTRAITDLSTSFRYIQQSLNSTHTAVTHLDQRMDQMERKLDAYNNLRERVDMNERCLDNLPANFVPRPEFDGAMKSVRQFAETKVEAVAGRISMLTWAIGIGFSTAGAAIGFLAARVFGV